MILPLLSILSLSTLTLSSPIKSNGGGSIKLLTRANKHSEPYKSEFDFSRPLSFDFID